MKTYLLNLLGDVLHIANSRPPLIRQREFYALKDKLLQRYGTSDGFDVQHIKKECWSCDGTGKAYRDAFVFGQWRSVYVGKCFRCNNGVYHEFWVRLERYRLGRHTFHIPKERTSADPGLVMQHPMIEGYIRHHDYPGHLPLEAAFWLFLVFEPAVFRSIFGRIGAHKARTPLCWLSDVVFWASDIPRFVRRSMMWRKYRQELSRQQGRLGNDDIDIPF